MLLIALIVGCAAGGVWLFTHSARFGALPQGEHLERLTRSPRYVDGEFRNELPTPILTEEKNMIATYAEFLFSRPEGLTPPAPVPAVRADLKARPRLAGAFLLLPPASGPPHPDRPGPERLRLARSLQYAGLFWKHPLRAG